MPRGKAAANPPATASCLALGAGVSLLVAGAYLGAATDVLPLRLRVMHLTIAAVFALMVPLAVYVHGKRMFSKGASDWVAWTHFALFAALLFLAGRMTRAWWPARSPAGGTAAEDHSHSHHDHESFYDGHRDGAGENDEDGERIVATYRGKRYDVTPFLPAHPGGRANLMRVKGGDLEEVWKENGVGWHASNPRVQKVLKRYEA